MWKKEVYWSKFASDFEKRQRYVTGENTFTTVINELKKEEDLGRCLELACGTGSYTIELNKKASSIQATDFSDEMIEVVKERTRGLSNISCHKANAMALQFHDNSFDTVFMANLIHVIPSPEKVIEESYRVLNKGGKIIVSSFTQEGMQFSEKIKMIYRFLKTFGMPPKGSKKGSTPKGVERLLQNSGFTIEKSKLLGDKTKCFLIVGIKK